MSPRFFDTNILVYAFGTDPRSEVARSLLDEGGGISVQSLNEFARVMTAKRKWSWATVRLALQELVLLCDGPTMIDIDVHARGLDIAERFQLHVFDAMIVASALLHGCEHLLTEDMHHGLVIDGRLTIVNPFRR